MTLAQFDFRVKHRPGRLHGNADGLTRARKDPTHAPTASMVCEALEACLTEDDSLSVLPLIHTTTPPATVGPQQ